MVCEAVCATEAVRRFTSCALALAWVVLIASASARTEELRARPMPIAVADFDYTDTSGEPTDQQAEHRARLQAFVNAIRADLNHDGHYRVVALACRQSRCAAGELSPADLIESARAAGAKRLLYGGIQKMSTLVQNLKIQVVDIEENKLTFDRLITFRGDTDESWQRAERFVVRDLLSDAPPQ
jgi:Tol biopolymer transport system component